MPLEIWDLIIANFKARRNLGPFGRNTLGFASITPALIVCKAGRGNEQAKTDKKPDPAPPFRFPWTPPCFPRKTPWSV
jgi:hypothetical protein